MAIDWSAVKAVKIPEGDVKRVAIDGVVVWEKPSNWDVEWYYTDGLPENNGFTKTITGSASSSVQNDGLRIVVVANGYIRYDMPILTMKSGTIEAKVRFDSILGYENMRLSASNGTGGVQVFANGGKLKLFDDRTYINGTPIADIQTGIWYTIRLELGSTSSDVYLNNSLIASNVPNSSMWYCVANRIWQQNSGQTTVEYIKLKKLHKSGRQKH